MSTSYATRRRMYDEAGIAKEHWIVAEVARKTGYTTRLCQRGVADPDLLARSYDQSLVDRITSAHQQALAEAEAFDA